jgi:hypothetical protein
MVLRFCVAGSSAADCDGFPQALAQVKETFIMKTDMRVCNTVWTAMLLLEDGV